MVCRLYHFSTAWGVPASLLYNVGTKDNTGNPDLHVFDACQHTTTLIDSLKMQMRAVDEILPTLKEVMGSVNKIRGLPEDLDGRSKMTSWVSNFAQMAADDSLTESQARQLAMDVEELYGALHGWLKGRKN